jgi:D-alanyl-D-alanine carboxypeptidase/D-alanyl-D-alanine-endopeptidase (penicillin-binding protein 4)
MRWASLLLVLASLAPAETLGRRIESIIASSSAAQRAFWGIEVVQTSTGKALFEMNRKQLFLPASNAKLFTTALALLRLGPEYRFETTIRSDAPPAQDGRLRGDLVLAGGGDPVLSARTVPYQRGPVTGNPLKAIEALADQVLASGVRRIDGDIAGDDTAYVWEPYPDGWAQDDEVWDYGAPVSALTVNDNVFTLLLKPAGTSASILLSPPIEFYSLDNRVRAGAGLPTKVRVERLPGSRQIRLWGTLGANPDGTQLVLAIDDPALYAARALADALSRRGISIAGRPVARHRYANENADSPLPGVVLARRASPPLLELLRIIDKASQNLHAEIILREIDRARGGSGAREAALEEERRFLAEAGIAADEFHFADASGLSSADLVTPESIVKVLRFMEHGQYRDAWVSLLPVGGQDGTLVNRFEGKAVARRIQAKTGSLSDAAALSGYIESRKYGSLAFSILVNNFNAPAAEIRSLIDRIALLLAG